ncbi:SPOR domain-containing protein [Ningiella sp. W23]|uniref:SPOR domain-containing protein n=1 Tax=Ningiella sp. W23 TaxID=3023715 RepID=UPI0037568A70
MNIVKILLFASGLVLISACSMVPDINMPNMFADVPEPIEQQIDAIDNEETYQELMLIKDELEQLRPDIYRVIALEGDIQYFLEHLESNTDMSAEANQLDGELLMESADDRPNFSNLDTPAELSKLRLSKQSPSLSASASSSVAEPSNKQVEVAAIPSLHELKNLKQTSSNTSTSQTQRSNKQSRNYSQFDKFSRVDEANVQAEHLSSGTHTRPTVAASPQNNLKQQMSEQARGFEKVTDERLSTDRAFAVHLVSMRQAQMLNNAWVSINQQYSNFFPQKTPLAQKVNVKGETYYSLRIGPFSKNEAGSVCSEIKSSGEYCGVLAYEGENL